MAQNFVGSLNINLLYPSGQFGTRLQVTFFFFLFKTPSTLPLLKGGKDAASPRYIYTRLTKLTRIIYHPDDDNILTYLDEDNVIIEPQWFDPFFSFLKKNLVLKIYAQVHANLASSAH